MDRSRTRANIRLFLTGVGFLVTVGVIITACIISYAVSRQIGELAGMRIVSYVDLCGAVGLFGGVACMATGMLRGNRVNRSCRTQCPSSPKP
jgi:hypothetical protein